MGNKDTVPEVENIPLEPNTNKTIIYAIRCNNDRYYVGRTNRLLEERVLEHFTNNGSSWTKMYPPDEVVESFESENPLDEDACVKKYMKKYGVENVRGGSYTQINLPEYKLKSLKEEFRNADNTCFKCGLKGHFARDCNSNDIDENKEKYSPNKTPKKISKCKRCGRKGHTLEKCRAKIHIDGENVKMVPKCDKASETTPKCDRCGRKGHVLEKCYAKMHINGNSLIT
jgi:predicted GIY-YIG superfamily endonuclease